MPIESCNIALFKHYIENMITFLGSNTSKTDIPSEFFAMEANIHQESIFLTKIFETTNNSPFGKTVKI